MIQAVQIAGALAILAGFALIQFRVKTNDTYAYLLLNLAGGILLLVSAVVEEQWGFIMLEAAWTLISAWGLATRWRRTAQVA